LTHWKRLWCWEGLGAGGEGDDRGWDGWMASPTRWTWVWVNSGRWWWTGRPGILRFMGLQRVGHNWVTELNWTEPPNKKISKKKNLNLKMGRREIWIITCRINKVILMFWICFVCFLLECRVLFSWQTSVFQQKGAIIGLIWCVPVLSGITVLCCPLPNI